VKDRLEIVIVAPSRKHLGLREAELEDFRQFHVVEIGTITSLGQAMTAGVRQACAPLAVFTEEHCYPEPGWAVALLEAHQQGWDAVGPVMSNANPQSLTSWASFFIGLGRWAEPAVAGETDDLPPHNASYKRTLLLAYGPALEAMLEVESVMHQDLRAKGCRLYWEPAAKVRHVSYSSLSSLLRAEFHYARLFAAARRRRWSLRRRLLYILGGPLIPLVRLRQVLGEVQRAGCQRQLLPGILPTLIVVLTSSAVGEMCGYAFGAGNAPQQKCAFDLARYRHLAKHDRQGEAF